MLKAAIPIVAVMAAIVSGTSALAATQPVELTTCRMTMYMPADGDKAPPAPLISGVAVTFVNHGQTVATEVDFSVSDVYRTELIKANGKFSPGVRIDKQFPNFAGYDYFREEPDACSIVRMKFADGTEWTAPKQAAY